MTGDCHDCQNRVIAKIENRCETKVFGNFGNSGDFGNLSQGLGPDEVLWPRKLPGTITEGVTA
jgi:hypothetical protein